MLHISPEWGKYNIQFINFKVYNTQNLLNVSDEINIGHLHSRIKLDMLP